jgi:hypothetical protein
VSRAVLPFPGARQLRLEAEFAAIADRPSPRSRRRRPLLACVVAWLLGAA